MQYTLQQIAQITGAKLIGNGNAQVQWLLTDSRAVSFPEDSLFVALKTARNDGHNYIAELYALQVRNFLVQQVPEHLEEANYLVTDDALKALQALAAYHRTLFTVPIIGITGSNGKTIVKEWLYQLLHKTYTITRSPRSYNSQIGVPLSVWELNAQTELGIFEAGISLPGEMEKLTAIISPTIGIFTHLGDAHQENFTSLKEKCSEKLRLFAKSAVLMYCKDDKLIDIAVKQAGLSATLFTWGKSKDATVRLVDKTVANGITTIAYTASSLAITRRELIIPFTDEASVENALHCLLVMLYFQLDDNAIMQGINSLESVPMRLEVKKGMNNCLLIDDAYNSDLGSLRIALDFHGSEAKANGMKRTVILSDILQSGQTADALYKTVADLLLAKKLDKLIAIGPQLLTQQRVFTLAEQYFFSTTEDFLQSAAIRTIKDEVILLKGSRQFAFEQITERLEAIAHQTTLEVDLNALIHNVNYFKAKLHPDTKIMSMVKAYAYGSGDIEVARTLQFHNCDYLAVAVADEGADLRREGIHLPIVVMNPEIGALGKIIDNRLEPEIYSFGLLTDFLNEARKQGVSNYPVHIKIDTGMNRLGFYPEEIPRLIELLQSQHQLLVRSVFTHLAGADEAQFDSFTEKQLVLYKIGCALFDAAFSYKIMKHVLNSAGIERFPQYQFDMVRLGIGHYGVSALNHAFLQEVCTLKTTILQIKTVPATETVGYGRKGKLNRLTTIATIPIGYADGYDRKLSNGVGKVWVNGQLAPILGNVCMDICMIDITGISANEGDTVIVFGKENSIHELAKQLDTIPYEILTGISRRVKRIYFKE